MGGSSAPHREHVTLSVGGARLAPLPRYRSPLVALHGLLTTARLGWKQTASVMRRDVGARPSGLGGSDVPLTPRLDTYAVDIAEALINATQDLGSATRRQLRYHGPAHIFWGERDRLVLISRLAARQLPSAVAPPRTARGRLNRHPLGCSRSERERGSRAAGSSTGRGSLPASAISWSGSFEAHRGIGCRLAVDL
jgi:hypothetical protein